MRRKASSIEQKRRAKSPPFSFLVTASAQLLLLRADLLDFLDRERRLAGLLGNLPVLLQDERAHRFVTVEAAEQIRWHAPVGPLGIVLIEDIEKGEFAFGIGSGFFGHGGF
jgi:hypothetical protein